MPSADADEIAGNQSTGTPSRGTPLAQGTSYETAVHQTVDLIAAAWGDRCIDTARSNGLISGCRKGDGVLIILGQPGVAEPARVVLEMTTEVGTRRDWAAYLEEAQRNRGAQAALGIVPNTTQVPGGERIRFYGTTKMVIAFDPAHDDPDILRAVLYLLRNLAITAASRKGTALTRDAEEKLTEAMKLLEQLDTLHVKATAACANVDKIAAELRTLRSRLYRTLTAASQVLDEAGARGAPPVPAPRAATTGPIAPEGSPQ